MEEETKKENRKEAGIGTLKLRTGIGCVIELILILTEIRLDKQVPYHIVIEGAIWVGMAIVLYLIISSILEINIRLKKEQNQKLEGIFDAQRASYLAARKYYDNLTSQIQNIETDSSVPTEDIINAQKAIAKITLNRNKENALALMESNEEMIEQLKTINEKLQQGTVLPADAFQPTIPESQSPEAGNSVKEEAVPEEAPVPSAPEDIPEMKTEVPKEEAPKKEEKIEEPKQEEVKPEGPNPEEPKPEESKPEIRVEETAPSEAAASVQGTEDSGETEPVIETTETAVPEEPVSEITPETTEVPEESPDIEIPEETPEADSTVPEPEKESEEKETPAASAADSDPNKILTPEEIEKLFANL